MKIYQKNNIVKIKLDSPKTSNSIHDILRLANSLKIFMKMEHDSVILICPDKYMASTLKKYWNP